MTAQTYTLVLAVQVPRPLDNPLIFGNFYVAFASTQRTSQQNTQRTFSCLCVAMSKQRICLLFVANVCIHSCPA